MSNPTADPKLATKRSALENLFMGIYLVPAMLVAVLVAYPIFIVRLSWDASTRMMKELLGDEFGG